MDIVVLAGGLSTERDVSFKTGDMVAQALKKKGHRVILMDVFMGYGEKEENTEDIFAHADNISVTISGILDQAPDLKKVKALRKDQSDCFFGPNVISICRRADIVFMALHGENGENGKVQAAFDLFGIRYTGSGYFSSAIAMDKGAAKIFFEKEGIPTPRGIKMERKGREDDFDKTGLKMPCVVKPCCGGSSIGVSIVRTKGEYIEALDEAFRWEEAVILEEYIEGREFSAGILGEEALPVIEIAPLEGFYDYKNKYKAGSAVETCPADIPEEIATKMQGYARKAAQTLGLSTYSRMDFILDRENHIYCLEANTLPGMTNTSLIPQEAQAVGVGFEELCEEIIGLSLQKYEG